MVGNEGSDDLFLYLSLVAVALMLFVAGALSALGSYSPGADSFEDGNGSDGQNLNDSMGKLGELAGEETTRTGGGEGSGTSEEEGTDGSESGEVGKEELEKAINEGEVDPDELEEAVNEEEGEADSEGVEEAVDEESEMDPEELEEAVKKGEISPEELEQVLSEGNGSESGGNTSTQQEGGNETESGNDTPDGGTGDDTEGQEGSGDGSLGGQNGSQGESQNGTGSGGSDAGENGGSGEGREEGNSTTSEEAGDEETRDEGGTPSEEGGSGGFSFANDIPVSYLLGVAVLVLVLLAGYLYRKGYRLPEALTSPKKFVSALTKASFDIAHKAELVVKKVLDADSYIELLSGAYAWLVDAISSGLSREPKDEPSAYGGGTQVYSDGVVETDGRTSRDFIHEAWSVVLDASAYSRPETKTPGQVSKAAVGNGLPSGPVGEITEAFRDVEYGGIDPDAKVDDVETALSELRERTGTQTDDVTDSETG